MKGYKKLMNGIAAVEKIVVSVILSFTTVLTFINVCVRKLTDGQFAWSEELVINLFVLIIMLGCGLAVRDEGGLVSLSLIFDRLSLKGKKIFVCIITAANMIFWAVLLWSGWDKVQTQMTSGKTTPSLGWPEWVFTIFLPIGAVFLMLHTIEFFLDFMGRKEEAVEEGGKDA